MSDFDCDIHQEDKDEIWQCLSCYDDGIKMEEQQRIIKLLLTHLVEESIWKPRTQLEENRKEFYARGIKNSIALIKGENK